MCEFKCKRQGQLNTHNETKMHTLILRLQENEKKLEEANLKKELAIQREQKLKQEVCDLAKENNNITQEKEKEFQKKLEEKEKEFQKKLEKKEKEKKKSDFKFIKEKRKRLKNNSKSNTTFENSKRNSLNSELISSYLSYNTTKTVDIKINKYLSNSEKNSFIQFDESITEKIKKEIELVDIEKINKANDEIDKYDENNELNKLLYDLSDNSKSNDISASNNSETSIDNVESNLTVKNFYPFGLEKESEELLLKHNFKFYDLISENKIKCNNKNYYVLIKKESTSSSSVFKYIYFLKRYRNSKLTIKFCQNNDIYLLHCKFKNNPHVILKERFYFSNVDIPAENIFISTINKEYVYGFNKSFKSLESSICNSVTSDFMGILLANGEKANQKDVKAFEILLQETLEALGIDFINEFACSVGMIPVLLGFSKFNKIQNMRNLIYGMEKTLKVNKITRRCDGIYDYVDRLIILEYKMNIFDKQNSLQYINDRGYSKHLIRYLLKYEPKILNEKKIIGQIGIEFYQNEVKVKIGQDLNIDEIINEINEESNITIDKKIIKKKKKQRRLKIKHKRNSV
mgnify:CR=1 FL=1